jgi:hypothetical protein
LEYIVYAGIQNETAKQNPYDLWNESCFEMMQYVSPSKYGYYGLITNVTGGLSVMLYTHVSQSSKGQTEGSTIISVIARIAAFFFWV